MVGVSHASFGWRITLEQHDTQQKSILSLVDDELVLDFPYDKDQVAEIKAVNGAKWDKIAKVWRVPATSLPQIRDFAVKHDFVIDDQILVFNTPVHRNPGDGISIKGNFVFLSFRYDPVMVRSVKQIEGITWDAKSKAWKAPLSSIDTAIKWARTFRHNVPDEVVEVAEKIRSELSVLLDASRSTDAEVNIPTLNGELLGYQRAGVSYATHARRVFVADEMGLGKTIQAMATLENIQLQSEIDDSVPAYPAVVVCPSSLVLNWKKEYNRFFPERIVEVVRDRKTIPMFGTYDVLVIGYPNINAWEKQLCNHNSYVFDESHYCKSPSSQRTKSAKKMTKSNKNAVVLCLTGTPVTNRPAEYAPQLDIIGQLDKFGGLWGFYRRYCGAYKDKWGQWHLEGHSNLEELNDKLRSICYIRRTKDQVMTDLPPVIHAPLVVEGAPAVMKEYAKAEADIVAYLVERAKEIAKELGLPVGAAAVAARLKAEANEHLLKMSVLRKISARAKMPVVEEWINERIEQGKKVVVAAHHRDIVNDLTNRFGGLKIQGQMDIEDIEDAKHKFQTLPCDQAPVIVLSIQAAKTGHTLTAAQDVLFVELPWTPADVDQTYSRCHRLGQKGSVTSTYMMTSGTIDEDIYALVERKRKVVSVATEGDIQFDDDDASNIILKLIEESLYTH
jgi:SWI/SNF-related matrix-associated actin-dependent regulator 1 of chromatin subfamily A